MAVIVCSCNVLSDAQVRDSVVTDTGPRKTVDVYRCLGCSPQCGRCARTIRAIMDDALGRPCETCPAVCPAAGHANAE
jgi:bacterioferritin-associated ferredoxin